MKAEDLVVGKLYRNVARPGQDIKYIGVIKEFPYIGEHTFDVVNVVDDFRGSVCTDSQVEKMITEIETGEELS